MTGTDRDRKRGNAPRRRRIEHRPSALRGMPWDVDAPLIEPPDDVRYAQPIHRAKSGRLP